MAPRPASTGHVAPLRGPGALEKANGLLSPEYGRLLAEVKERIRQAQVRASVSVNRELVALYWQIGRAILERQRAEGWGAGVLERLAMDLHREFPGMSGLSPRNLGYMKAFAEAYPDLPILQQAVAKLPWGHNIALLEKVGEPAERLWYARKAVENGWSRSVLVHQVESGLFHRQGRALTNFARTLPARSSDLARELLRDPYAFDFLELTDGVRERDLERALLRHLRDLLLELGVGFSFVGSDYHLEVGGEDFYLDLLFYHLRLRCFVVIELKAGEFRPEDAGKMGFYLSAVDDLLRHEGDAPSIGVIMCRTRNRVVAEYALRDTARPMGVATWRLTRELPEGLAGRLPSIEEIERGLSPTSRKRSGS